MSALKTLLLLAVPVASANAQVRVSMTIDDLPWSGPASSEEVSAGTDAIITALSANGIPAIGFVVCNTRPADNHILHRWLDAGLELGNHSARHMDLNNTGIEVWIADATECHERLQIWEASPEYFRFPMLHQGNTRQKRDRVAEAIERLGYRTAHVTIDNSEWLIANAYREARSRADSSTMASLRSLYADHLSAALLHADSVANERFGRPVAQILLLHANQLLADALQDLLEQYEAIGVEWISLDEALDDPVYELEDGYVGSRGLSWLYRAAPTDESWSDWDEREAARVRYLISDI